MPCGSVKGNLLPAWTQEEDEFMLQLTNEGYIIADICKAMNEAFSYRQYI